MKVLLFGATGFLGARVGERLRTRGDAVIPVVRPGAGGAGAAPALEMELAGDGPLPEPPRCDAALYLAQSSRYREWPEGAPDMVGVNLLGATRALELSRRAGVRRFLLASSGSVYGAGDGPLREDAPLRGTSFYARTKRMAEELLLAFAEHMETLCMRPFVLYGPGQRERMVPGIVARVASGEPVRLEPRRRGEERPGGFVTSPCYVDDAASIVAELLDSSATGVLNLAGPEAVSVREIAERAAALLGREATFRIGSLPRAGDLVADTTALRKRVSVAFTPFAEGLRRVVECDFAPPR